MEELREDSAFEVRNSIWISLFICIAFSAMAYSAVIYNVDSDSQLKAKLFTLIPAIIFAVSIFNRKPFIIINKDGIFVSGNIITDWAHFDNAFYTQQTRIGSMADNFVLIVEYSKDGIPGYFKSTIPLSNTQDKSEEAVIAAIVFFNNLYQNRK